MRRYQTIIFPPLTIRIDYNKPVYSNKSHGWDELHIKMIEMYDKTLAYPLKLIYKLSFKRVISGWLGKSNAVPIYKKEGQNLLEFLFIPIILLPVVGKIYERIILKELFNHFHQNRLFTKYKSGFPLDDSCISRLLLLSTK